MADDGSNGGSGAGGAGGGSAKRDILAEIIAHKRTEVEAARRAKPLEVLEAEAVRTPPPRNFFRAVASKPAGQVALIAEIKKASPSAGVIRADFDPPAIARTYESAGAAALSVLTDEKYFQGSLDYLRAVKAAVNIPVLRKDFLIDEYQLYESRAAGADAVLLIGEALPAGRIMDMMITATRLGLSILLEVHGAEKLLDLKGLIGFPQPGYSLLGITTATCRRSRST
jgi:indole-3-glycerol phosphate synthase